MHFPTALNPGVTSTVHATGVIESAEAMPAVLTRTRSGLYSPTVGRIRTALGDVIRADLIRLTPNVDAYSLDAHGASPRHRAEYRADRWSAVEHRAPECERQIVWILRNSYPSVGIAALTRAVRASGVEPGPGDIPIHEAIAATQAALWRFTDGIELDESALGLAAGPHTAAPRPTRPAIVPLETSGAPRVTGYSIVFAGRVAAGVTTVLQGSIDGDRWQDIPSSHVAVPAERHGCRVVKGLAAGATTVRSVRGRASGYAAYRLVVSTDATTAPVRIVSVELDVADQPKDANSRRLLAVYRYLCEGAQSIEADALQGPSHALLSGTGPLGPFLLDADRVQLASVRAFDSNGAQLPVCAADGTTITYARGGEPFFVHGTGTAARVGTVTVAGTIEVGSAYHGIAVTGVEPATGARLATLGLVERRPVTGVRFQRAVSWRAAEPAARLLAAVSN